MKKRQKAIFLDRDGVINLDTGYPHKIEDFSLIKGILDLCLYAQKKGYKLIVISNQSGLARGIFNREQLFSFHSHIESVFRKNHIQIEAFYFCPHHPAYTGKCLCRKPGSLLLEKAIARFNILPEKSWMIGDSERDILAGQKVGCKTLLFGAPSHTQADHCVKELANAHSLL